MTEAEWLACADPQKMLEFFSRRRRKSAVANERKLTLFACACCRRIWHFIPTDPCRDAVDVAERYVDELATEMERHAAWSSAVASAVEEGIRVDEPYDRENVEWGCVPGGLAVLATLGLVGVGDVSPGEVASTALGEMALDTSGLGFRNEEAFRHVQLVEHNAQVILLRHIIGNPFRLYPAPDHWPTTVVQLANALYNGQDCGFALHDALLEAGQVDLAEHFRQEMEHPKGCWAVDLILGKK